MPKSSSESVPESLCGAEVGEANSGEVLVEDLPDVRGGKLFDHAERLVQS